MIKYICVLAGMALAASAADANPVTIKYELIDQGPINPYILTGPISGTLTFDPSKAMGFVVPTPSAVIGRYASPDFKHTYNLFGEQLSGEFSVDLVHFNNGGGQIYFYTPVPETGININLILEWSGNTPFAGAEMPMTGYETANFSTITFVDPNNFGPLGFVAYGPAKYSVSYANAVPEPATWAMMIGGMGMVGGVLRRRRTAHRVTIAA